jgi:hypothetical protein
MISWEEQNKILMVADEALQLSILLLTADQSKINPSMFYR